jgi:hypothetical protein
MGAGQNREGLSSWKLLHTAVGTPATIPNTQVQMPIIHVPVLRIKKKRTNEPQAAEVAKHSGIVTAKREACVSRRECVAATPLTKERMNETPANEDNATRRLSIFLTQRVSVKKNPKLTRKSSHIGGRVLKKLRNGMPGKKSARIDRVLANMPKVHAQLFEVKKPYVDRHHRIPAVTLVPAMKGMTWETIAASMGPDSKRAAATNDL